MSRISLKVNGKPHTVDLDPQTLLLYVLSDELGLRGPKFGCGMAQCGSCTVILRGQVVRSCVMPVSAVLIPTYRRQALLHSLVRARAVPFPIWNTRAKKSTGAIVRGRLLRLQLASRKEFHP